MLFKSSIWGPANTDEEYREILKRRIKLIPVLMLGGAASIAVSVILMQSGEEKDFLAGMYMGIGCGLLGASTIQFLWIRSILKDAKKLRMKRLQEYDERNVQLNLKAHNTAGALLIVIGYVLMLVAGFFSMEVFWTVWVLVMLYFILFIAVRMIYDRMM
ncbi:hypothetical protein AALC16_18100 [Lachnospiraceae bacterium 29-91]|jgi:hypothetical protein|nr:hypothetical protein [uncultured Schaedlerella sp.]EOS36469.1 hypothetical protein C808_04040 [Lachnospiraceae bacterium M18-1]